MDRPIVKEVVIVVGHLIAGVVVSLALWAALQHGIKTDPPKRESAVKPITRYKAVTTTETTTTNPGLPPGLPAGGLSSTQTIESTMPPGVPSIATTSDSTSQSNITKDYLDEQGELIRQLERDAARDTTKWLLTDGITTPQFDLWLDEQLVLRKQASDIARMYGIPPQIFHALIKRESGWNHKARSRVGAIGLTQVMPFNIKAMGYDVNVFKEEPVVQLELGAKYLSNQYKTFGRWDLALAAYNAGPGAVRKYGGVPPYKETINYVKYILTTANNSIG